eukprot:CAMPEP_0176415434 /NCGR_PEP_ID=MMETSP0127-20121128/5807_1 /TAXON_ID=938130 /ORGANISM="Platyophrya macrostoma, Strain WH" /LENGTH=154 /DNA_ID=CAMNT_0017795435 /DNA_START=66 /DNA_END=530 /DNA_ORIENTATION=-
MAQFVPKTAWKVNNLTQRYGAAFVGTKVQSPQDFFSSTRQPQKYVVASESFNSKHYSSTELSKKLQEALRQFALIDVRDEPEARHAPIKGSTQLHHHDILSGACLPLLPRDRNAEIFVVASARQRSVNAFNALHRLGYENVVVMDAEAAFRALQ